MLLLQICFSTYSALIIKKTTYISAWSDMITPPDWSNQQSLTFLLTVYGDLKYIITLYICSFTDQWYR